VAYQRSDEVAARLILLVDTNVLLDVVQDDPKWAEWSIGQLRAQAQIHEVAINPVIYAGTSLAFSTIEALDDVVARMELALREIPRAALFLAGRAFVRYRRRGGGKAHVLPGFFIGAHAAVQGWPLLARDASRFRTYFPGLVVIAP
jgi:predicted nucleic acid-binding protein